MTDLRTAAQAALVALEESVDGVQNEYDTDWRHGMPTRAAQLDAMRASLEKHKQAIASLRAALSAPAPDVAGIMALHDGCVRLHLHPEFGADGIPVVDPDYARAALESALRAQADEIERLKVDVSDLLVLGDRMANNVLAPRKAVRLTDEQIANVTVTAKPMEWGQDSGAQWNDRHYGFSIIEESGDDLPFCASWGEGDSEQFATLEQAQVWCQSQIDAWITKYASLKANGLEP